MDGWADAFGGVIVDDECDEGSPPATRSRVWFVPLPPLLPLLPLPLPLPGCAEVGYRIGVMVDGEAGMVDGGETEVDEAEDELDASERARKSAGRSEPDGPEPDEPEPPELNELDGDLSTVARERVVSKPESERANIPREEETPDALDVAGSEDRRSSLPRLRLLSPELVLPPLPLLEPDDWRTRICAAGLNAIGGWKPGGGSGGWMGDEWLDDWPDDDWADESVSDADESPLSLRIIWAMNDVRSEVTIGEPGTRCDEPGRARWGKAKAGSARARVANVSSSASRHAPSEFLREAEGESVFIWSQDGVVAAMAKSSAVSEPCEGARKTADERHREGRREQRPTHRLRRSASCSTTRRTTRPRAWSSTKIWICSCNAGAPAWPADVGGGRGWRAGRGREGGGQGWALGRLAEAD